MTSAFPTKDTDNFGGGENIYYEENSNIVLIDPNSVKDSNGVKKDRVIKQEDAIAILNNPSLSLIAKDINFANTF